MGLAKGGQAMTPDETIKLLAEMLEPYAHCEYTAFAYRPPGWTCLMDMASARALLEQYAPERLQRLCDGEELCEGCRARELLNELGLGGKS